MATISITNQIAASALRGECVQVTLNATDRAKLPNITVGMLAQAVTSLKIGYVSYVDILGNSLQIKPINPASTFDNGTQGELAVGDVINLT